jgi:hypothetical protein
MTAAAFSATLATPLLAAPARRNGALGATMDCRSEPGSGRLVCTIELVPPAGHRLTWSDALVVAAPPAATPLRSRVRGSGTPPQRILLGFALGQGAGGRIEVLARAVACAAKTSDACSTLAKSLAFEVEGR